MTRESNSALLAGNGAGLIREIALAKRVQRALERLYQLDSSPSVDAFMAPAESGEREALLVRETGDGDLEIELRVPFLQRQTFDIACGTDLDPMCQIIEGVSHFVYIANRASREREATQLELELQAEVDKYVVLAASLPSLNTRTSKTLRERLFEDISFSHDEESECGERYRVANRLALRFVRHLERDYISANRFSEMRRSLRAFYQMGQEEKIRISRAA